MGWIKLVHGSVLPLAAMFFCQSALTGGFREDLTARSLSYFLDHTHPVSGLVRDKAANFGPTPDERRYRVASIAATGMGLAARAHAARTGRLSSGETERQLVRTLEWIERELDHHHGWLYHFVDWETGERAGRSEISTIDTALFLGGAYAAAALFPGSAIPRIVERLHDRVDFGIMRTNGGATPLKQTLSMGWTPEAGYIPYDWDIYSEHLILYLLGLGHPSRPLEAASWEGWERRWGESGEWSEVLGGGLPLFIHQYNFLYLDPRTVPLGGIDLFQNSRRATLLDRATCASASASFATYSAGYWGLSASDSARGYRAFSPLEHDGTVCPGCAGGSLPFVPELIDELERWASGPLASAIWGKYGFVDAFNLDPRWFSPEVLGITVGTLYLAIANASDNSIWSATRGMPFLERAYARLGG